MFTPNTSVKLLNVPFSSDGVDTVFFSSVTDQQAYFLARVKVDCGDSFNYVKKDNTIVVRGTPEQLCMVNYIMYKNNNYLNKWFYAFVTKIEWASCNSTRLYLRTDPIQTWLFELVLYKSFIIRQHSVTDRPGDNIISEPIGSNLGFYSVKRFFDVSPNAITIWATCDETGNSFGAGSVSRGIFQGAYPAAELDYPGGYQAANEILTDYVNNGVADGIVKIVNSYSPATVEIYKIDKYGGTCDGYLPRNKKLLSGAFCKCFISCMGQEQVFNPENCKGETFNISLNGDDTSGTLLINVDNYSMGTNELTPYSASVINIEISYPEGTWAYNQYRNDYNLHSYSNALMVQQKEVQRGYNYIRAGAGAFQSSLAGLTSGMRDTPSGEIVSRGEVSGYGAATDAAINYADYVYQMSQISGGYDNITRELAVIGENYDAPPTGGASLSTPYFVCSRAYLVCGYITPLNSIARAYDDFLTMFGYAQNKFAVPNLHARKSFTYIKVSELHAGGELPDSDMLAIKAMFANGIYFWDPSATIGDFSQDNSVL